MDETARCIAREVRAHTSHCALALWLLRHALLGVRIKVLRVLAHSSLRRRDLLNDALRERMLAGGLASSVQLLLVEEHGLGVLVLLASRDICLLLAHARAAHGVELVDLHLRRLRQIIRLVVVLDRDVTHGLTDRLLPELLLRFLVVVRQLPTSLPDVLHRYSAVGSSSSGGIAVLTGGVEALSNKLLRPFGSVVEADLGGVRVRLLALLGPILLVARLGVHICLIAGAVRSSHNLWRLYLWIALMVHIVTLRVGRGAALVLARLTVHLLRM